MSEALLVSDVELPPWCEPFFKKKRYKVAKGGRGSSKSWTVAQLLLLMASETPLRILCAREFQKTIKDSVHKLLKDQIALLGLDSIYRVTENAIYGTNGSEFIFAGLHANITSIKSLEGINICWIEEAETVSTDSWKNLIPTIRKTGSEIWITYNPREPDDPTSVLVEGDPEKPQSRGLSGRTDAIVIDVNWRDNPWFHETELVAEKDAAFATDPEDAEWVWEGKFRKRNDAVIFAGKFQVQEFEVGYLNKYIGRNEEGVAQYQRIPVDGWEGPYYGADWGFSQDPTIGIRGWMRGNTLYLDYETSGVGIELNDIAPRFLQELPGLRDGYLMRADSARPETISHVRAMGVNVIAAEKWPGSVEDGIEYIRSLDKVIVHPRCTVTIEESKKYKYKVDRITGKVTRVPASGFDHAMDTIRYMLEPAIAAKDAESIVELGEDLDGLLGDYQREPVGAEW